MNFIQIEQLYDLSRPNDQDDFQIGLNKLDPQLDQVAIKKMKYKKDFQQILAKIPLIVDSSKRCGLVPPLGYYKNPNSNQKELFLIYKKYSGSYAELKAKKIKEEKFFTKDEIQSVINCVLLSLRNLHKKALYHSNIKLTNIFYLEGSQQVYLSEAGYLSQKEKHKEWFLTPEEIPDHEYFTEDPEDLDYQQMDSFQFGMILVELVSLKARKDLECLKYDYGEMGKKREELLKEISAIISDELFNIIQELLVVQPIKRKKILQFDEDFYLKAKNIESGREIGTLPRITNADIGEYESKQEINEEKKQQQNNQEQKQSDIKSLQDLEDIAENKQLSQKKEEKKIQPNIQQQNIEQIQQINSVSSQNQKQDNFTDDNFKKITKPSIKLLESQTLQEENLDEEPINHQVQAPNPQGNIKLVDSERIGQAQQSIQSSQNKQQDQNQDIRNQEKPKQNLLESEIIQTNSWQNSNKMQHSNKQNNLQSIQGFSNQNYMQIENTFQNQFQVQQSANNNEQNPFDVPDSDEEQNQNNQIFQNKGSNKKIQGVRFSQSSSNQGSQVQLVTQPQEISNAFQNYQQSQQDQIFKEQLQQQTYQQQLNFTNGYSPSKQNNIFSQEELSQIIKIIQKCIDLKQIDILDVFVYYDQDYDYTLSDPETLNKILTIIGLLNNQITEQQSLMLYENYSYSPQKMQFLGLLQQLVSPKQLFVSLLINLLKINRWSILQLFERYQNQNSNCWGLQELIQINYENQFNFDEITLNNIMKEFLEYVDSQDQTLNAKELAQIIGFRIQTPNEMIVRSINQRMHSQIKRLTEIQLQDLIQKQREQELERQLEIERQKREKILQQMQERQEKELNYKKQQELLLKQEQEYEQSKRFLPSISMNQIEKVQVNKQMFWKTLGQAVAQQSFDPIMSRRQDNIIYAKDFYRALVEDYEFTDCLELREFVDSLSPNRKINISKIREKLKLTPDMLIPDTKDDDLVLPDSMINDIKELFQLADRDGSGSIEKYEIENLLKWLGINAKDEELDQFFKKYDKDGDKTISYKEFQIIMTQQIYNNMLNVSDIIDDIKTLFKRVDINNTNTLSKDQLSHVLASLGIILSEEEVQSIFNEIDQDKSGGVQLNEFISFIKRDLKKIQGLQACTIIKIRSCTKPTIHELSNLFINFPQNYIFSFLYQKIKNGYNLPSLGIKPKIHGTTGTIKDLFLISDSNVKNTLLKGKKQPNEILAEITLSQAMCLPFPKDKQQIENIKFMEVVVCMFDRQRKKFVGNCCRMEAQYQESKVQGNCWNFKNDDEQNSFLVRYTNYNEKRDSELVICFEFVLHYQLENKMVTISIGFTEINLSDLKETGKKLILINGGDPFKQINIDWLYLFPPDQMQSIKTLSDIRAEPCLKLFVSTKIHDEDITLILPGILLMNRKFLHLFKAFREYLAENFSTQFLDPITLKEDLKVKSFLAVLNCPDTEKQIAEIWDKYFLPNIANDVKKEVQFMSQLLHSLSGLISNKQFGFRPNDPTKCSFNDPELQIMRKSLFDYYINDLLQRLQLKEKESIKFPVGKRGGEFEPPDDLEDEDDQLLDNDDLVRAKTINLQQKKPKQEDEEMEEYKESITGEDYLFLFTTEDINQQVFQQVSQTRILLIDFREQISRGKYSLAEIEQIAKAMKLNRHLKSLYLKLSLSSYDDEVEKIKIAPLLTTLSTTEVRLKSLYLHLDYNDLSVDNACYKLIAFLRSQSSCLQNLNLNLENTNMSYDMGKDFATCLSFLTLLQNLNLNVSLNPLGPNFVERLASSLKYLTNLTCLKLDLEKIEMKEFCLSCYCGYYLRVCLQFLPLIGSCCMWMINFYTALEHVADAISCMDKLQYLNLNVAQNSLGDRLMRHFEYKFGKALYTRPNLTTLILNFKRNRLVKKTIKSISTLGISSFKVDLRYNYIAEEGLSKIAPSLYSLRNIKNLSITMEGNKNKELINQQSSSKVSTENNKQSQIRSGPNSQLNSLQNSKVDPNNNNSNFMGQSNMKNSQMEILNDTIDYKSQKYYENKILKSIASMPQIENIEISGLGGINGRSNQNSIISNKFPAIKQMYLRARRMNMNKYYNPNSNYIQNYQIPIKYIFNEEDDIDTIISLFCNSQTLDEIHLQFLYDYQVLKTSLNLKYFNPIIVIDYSDCTQLELPENFNDFLNLINKNEQSLERLYIGGIQFQEQQLQSLSRALHKIVRQRGKPLAYLEYSHFNLYNEFNASKPSFSICDRFLLFCKDFFNTFCDFKEEVFRAQEEQNLIQIQNFLPEIAQATETLTVRNLVTLSYYRDQKYVEIKSFDQENIMEFRLFDLLQGLQMNDVRTIVVRNQLVKEGGQVLHLNQINHLNDQQFSSFMRCDLKKNFPFLERLEVVFAPSPNQLTNCLKSLSIKLLQNQRKQLKNGIIISHEQQKDYEDEIDKDPIEKELIENKGWYLFYFTVFWLIVLTASVIIPFFFTNDCGKGHSYVSHIIFAGFCLVSILIEFSIIKYSIIPNQRPKLLSGRDKSWRRRLTEHLKNQGDLYALLLVSLIGKFDLYANFLFITITHTCNYWTLFIISLCFIGTNFLFNFSQIIGLMRYVTNFSDNIKDKKPYLLADVFSQLTNFLNMFGISYIMDFKEVNVSLLFSSSWIVPVNMCFTLLKLIFDNFPMLVLKIIFLMDKKVSDNLQQTSIIISAISSVINAVIFGLILVKKFEEFRYSLKPKGSFCCINYERQDLEEFLGKPKLMIKQKDEENQEELDKSIIEEDTNQKNGDQKKNEKEGDQDSKKIQEEEEIKSNQEEDKKSNKEADKKNNQDEDQKSIQSDKIQEDQPLKQEQNENNQQSQNEKVEQKNPVQEQSKGKMQQQDLNKPIVPQNQNPKEIQADTGCCSCLSFCCCCIPQCLIRFLKNLFKIKIKDITFFYEKAIQDLDISIRFRISIYKFYLWIASVGFYSLSFILPFYFYDNCENGVSHKIFYIFIGVSFFITILEYNLIKNLVRNMYEIPRKEFNSFPFAWVVKLFFSMILKSLFMVDFVVLIYGKKCFDQSLVFDLIFISVCIVFFLRAFKQLRYLFKPLQTDTLFPVITRFTILADLCSMMLLPKLVYPYLPERRITRLKIPDNLMTSFLKFVLQDYLMIVLNIIYLIYILSNDESDGNIFEYVIVSLSLSVIQAYTTIKWWSWPLKMSKQEDLERVFIRNEEIVSQTQKDEQEYNKILRNHREVCCCLVQRNGCISKCLGLD
ncbi:EF hand protein (macronuclear) [Tetrahymena thermophila SB210]|uniref:EF hand protein n=1 Tax=Tetrahymena thermophila (strain SB210) TaxID=312017 RepID=I7LXB1_TETTS|nr:EF hand protein [Tetrahymena thermophila SB210]EAS04294.2 EF hand protein [Tetrahymena thermophila SB210]|eukprot:XP_001024539.2 EF hand protein [Tetrahymena thermophila SB210]